VITLYDCATAPSPRRARIFLTEKGVAFETVQVDLRNAEQLSNAFRAVNPQCTVPALQTDEGVVLTDNAAIAAYLEARYPQPPLLGVNALDKAEIASWNWRMEFEGLMAIAEALRNSAPAMLNRALRRAGGLRANSRVGTAWPGANSTLHEPARPAFRRPRFHRR